MNTEKNKDLALAFYNMAFILKEPLTAARRYLGEPYIQHNPNAEDGREYFGKLFERIFEKFPESTVTVKRVVAEGAYVVLHVHAQKDVKDRGQAVVEIFRFADGKIVEHWDVLQDIPVDSANSNTMF